MFTIKETQEALIRLHRSGHLPPVAVILRIKESDIGEKLPDLIGNTANKSAVIDLQKLEKTGKSGREKAQKYFKGKFWEKVRDDDDGLDISKDKLTKYWCIEWQIVKADSLFADDTDYKDGMALLIILSKADDAGKQ